MGARLRWMSICVGLGAVLASCAAGGPAGDRVEVVASVYPLAWMTERVGGNTVDVTDLTPAGVEAHDLSLTAEQRAAIEDADVLIFLGRHGFQPEVEGAIGDAPGEVVTAFGGTVNFRSGVGAVEADVHRWLDPVAMRDAAPPIASALEEATGDRATVRAGLDRVLRDLDRLDAEYRSALADCEHRTLIVTHEAFGYLAERYGLMQLGIAGLVPESEPGAAGIRRALEAIRTREAAPAVFYEETAEGRRIAESLAADAGVPLLPLNTLESTPLSGDYLSVMRDNLASLTEGLGCRSSR